LFTITQPSGASCYTYSLFLSNGVTSTTTPSYITLNYPSLTIGSTVAGQISTTSQIIYTWKVKATNTVSGANVLGGLTITINHECSTATITTNTAGDSYTY
jgi:hypothetical protein